MSEPGIKRGRVIKAWIEAMRLRTLPVSVAGVITGTGCALAVGGFNWVPALICLIFAILAQIASNFGNEYFDFRHGLDKKGREGFRRGVTEGDLTPVAMRNATFATLVLSSVIGLSLLLYGGWWLIAVGVAVAVFALAYSAGPFPLSSKGWGDVAVIIFFGFVPVILTAYLQTGDWKALPISGPLGLSTGMLAALVLVVNNYRDMDDDREVGKKTTVVRFGRRVMSGVYLASSFVGVTVALVALVPYAHLIFPIVGIIFLFAYYMLYRQLIVRKGKELNPILGMTAMLLLAFSIFVFSALAAGRP